MKQLIFEKHDYGLEGIEKYLKLYTTQTTTNMHLFNEKEQLKRYDDVYEIVKEYYSIRYRYYNKRREYLIDKLTIKFCGTLANNGRLIFIHEIIDVFLSEVSRINGEVQAEVTSSFELDKEQQNKVESAISEATGVKKIILSTKVDETLIGGLIVKIGSKMIDNSIKTKLNRLEIAMRGAN